MYISVLVMIEMRISALMSTIDFGRFGFEGSRASGRELTADKISLIKVFPRLADSAVQFAEVGSEV